MADLSFDELSCMHSVKILKKLFFLLHLISSQNNVYFSFLWHLRAFRLKMTKLLDLHGAVDKNFVQKNNTIKQFQ